jgi:hypothetical protein
MNETDLAQLARVLLWINTAGYVVLAFRIAAARLHRTYRCFFWYMVFRAGRAIALSLTISDRNAYSYIWVYSLPVLWFLYALVLLELYSLVLENYKGLATVGRWAMLAGMGMAVAVASISLGPDLNGAPNTLRYLLVADRGVQSSLLLFLLAIAGFLAWYPVKLSRNVVIHSITYACYFGAGAALTFVRNVKFASPFAAGLVNVGLTTVTLLCLLTWIVFLNRRGEAVTVSKRPQWQPDDEKHLIEQLTAINASLLRTARK